METKCCCCSCHLHHCPPHPVSQRHKPGKVQPKDLSIFLRKATVLDPGLLAFPSPRLLRVGTGKLDLRPLSSLCPQMAPRSRSPDSSPLCRTLSSLALQGHECSQAVILPHPRTTSSLLRELIENSSTPELQDTNSPGIRSPESLSSVLPECLLMENLSS